MNATRLRVRAPFPDQDCVATADSVFEKEGFVAAFHVSGPGRFYSPRASAISSLALQWGISVTIDSDRGGPCDFELEALSMEEGCGISCPLTSQPGAQFNDVTRKMARLLDGAFRGHSEK
jgi:hypothetical protein